MAGLRCIPGFPRLSKILLAASLAAISCLAQAQTRGTNSGPFQVRIYINPTCQVALPDDIDFGAPVHRAGYTEVLKSELIVQCTKDHTYSVNLDAGLNLSDGYRHMVHSGGKEIRYELAQNSSMTPLWDPSQQYPGTGTGIGLPSYDQIHDIYARAYLAGDEFSGNYVDTVEATVTY